MSEDFYENEKNFPLDEIETNEKGNTKKQTYVCPRCGSTDIEDWGDGNLICNNCDKQFIDF